MMGEGRGWFKGSADAIYQNLDIITDEKPKTVAVFGADHIYVIDIRQMLNFHRDRGGEVTVAAIPVPIKEARAFGIIEVDQDSRIIGYEEKPDKPKPIPGQVDMAFASMGNYIFNTTTLIRELEEDAHRDASVHDFSRSIIAKMFKSNQVYAYDFRKNRIPGQGPGEIGYWKDVGTIESYYQASMDLVSVTPLINIHNDSWPIWTPYAPLPPSKFVWSERDRMGYATESLISEGCIISGGQVKRSILAPKVRINSYALLEESILFHNVEIGRHSKIRRTIIDKNVRIPPNTVIGYDRKEDERRFHVSESGIVIVSKGTVISA
jgi:glucose-1-phosphate adenylyltransferase